MSAAAGAPEANGVPLAASQALYLYGVVRARGWRGRRIRQGLAEGVVHIRYRDLEALVRSVPYEQPAGEPEELRAHQRVLEGAMRRGAVLPLPFGVVFRSRRQLIQLLHDQYLVLDDALSFVDGAWELRLHISAATVSEPALELANLANRCYAELRRHARAAVPLPGNPAEKRLLTAAYLVERATWIDFVERADDLGGSHPELTFDVTGPWPPYDFVRIGV